MWLRLLVLCTLVGCSRPRPEPPPPPDPGLEYVDVVRGEAGDPLPLIVAIHGLGDRPESFVHVLDKLPGPARVVAPRAPTPWGDGGTWFDDAGELAASADRVADLIRLLQRESPTRGKARVTGFSQGGMLSFAIAVRHPDLVDRAVPVAGTLPEALWPGDAPRGGGPRIAALHGTADPRVPFEEASRLVEYLEAHGWTASMAPASGVGHAISPQMHRRMLQELQ